MTMSVITSHFLFWNNLNFIDELILYYSDVFLQRALSKWRRAVYKTLFFVILMDDELSSIRSYRAGGEMVYTQD